MNPLHPSPASTALVGLLPLLLALASGCSSDGGATAPTDPDVVPPGSEPVPTPDAVRLSSRVTDRSGNGRDDRRETFAYDEAGRVLTHMIENLNTSTSQVIVFDYATDGRLLTKTDGESTDSYTYDGGRVVSASREAQGELSYRYDAGGRLIGVTGEGFDFDDDCISISPDGSFPAPRFEVTYADDRIVRVDDTVNGDTTSVTRDAAGRLRRVLYTGNCYEPESQRDEYVYNEQGQLTELFIEGTGFRRIRLVTQTFEGDRLAEVNIEAVERGSGDTEAEVIVRTHDGRGQLVSQRVTADGVELGEIRYTYEPGDCQRPGSADPSNVLNVESARLQSGRTPALLCGYWFDERDF